MNKINWKDIKDNVFTKHGNVELEKIKVGDEVLGKNVAGEYEFYIVTGIGYFQKKDSREWVIVNENLKFAWHQSIYINGKLKHAREINVGNSLETIDGSKLKVETVRKIKDFSPKIKLTIDAKRNWLDKLLGRNKHTAHTFFINNVLVHNASRYWVGGSGTWDATSTTNWSASSGGASGASVPTSSDDAIFDANSGTTTCTLSGTIPCANFDASATSLLTFAGTSTGFRVYGNFTLKAGMTWSHNGQINFYATTTGKTVTTAAVSLSASLYFGGGGAGGGWTLQDAVVSTRSVYLIAGTLDTNNQNVTCNTGNVGYFGFSGVAGNTRVLTLGSSTITTNNLEFSETYRATLTFNYNTSTIDAVNSANTARVGGMTFYNLKLRISGSNYGSSVEISGDPTITNDLTITGYDTQYRLPVRSSAVGTQRTITANNIVSLTNCDFRDIVGAGAASWTGTSIGDQQNNSGITFTSPVTRYWVGNGGSWGGTTHWSATSGGASGASMPIAQDTAIFDANSFSSGSQTVTVNVRGAAGNLDFTNVTNNPTLGFSTGSVNPIEIYGYLTLKSGMSWTSANYVLAFFSRSSITLTTAGVTINQPITINTFGTTTTLGDDITLGVTRQLTITNGTLTAVNGGNNYIISAGSISIGTAGTLTLGSATHLLTGTGTVWSCTGTVNVNTSTIKATDTSATAITFSGGGKTYNIVWFDRGASTANITISGSNTFSEFKDTGTAAHSLIFTASTTQTITTWTVTGSSGNAITLTSTSATDFNLVKSGVGLVSSDWLNIQNSDATPANKWYAGANSVDNQGATGGTGWIFTAPPRPYNQGYMIG